MSNITSEEYKEQLTEALQKLIAVKPVGEEWFSTDGTIPSGGLAYLGQYVTRAMYADLWNYLNEKKQSRILSDEEWDVMYNNQNGHVPFYSSGDGSTTFRMPSYRAYIKGAESVDETGIYVKEGMPNITGSFIVTDNVATNGDGTTPKVRWGNGALQTSSSGARNTININDNISVVSGTKTDMVTLDAALSNAIYGNSDHVTPETGTVLFGVYAFGIVREISSIDSTNILNRLQEIEEATPTIVYH